MFARFAGALLPAVAASLNVWLARPPLFPRVQGCSGPIHHAINGAHVLPTACLLRRPSAIPHERRGSTGLTGLTERCSRATSRSDTRHASSALQVYRSRRRNSEPAG